MFAFRPAFNISRSFYAIGPLDESVIAAALAIAAGSAGGVAMGLAGVFVPPDPAAPAAASPTVPGGSVRTTSARFMTSR